MSVCFVFPGQGSQSVGMGKDLSDNCPAARAVFEEVDSALGQKLSEIIFNGPMEELTLTANVQPAIFAASMAMLKAWEEKNNSSLIPHPSSFVAGHSLGEYTALCAIGAIGIADTAQLLRLRGDAMQSAVPIGTGMVSVIMGLELNAVMEICDAAGAELANDNGANQFVISGLKDNVERAMELAKARGAKRAMKLPLSAPVHCSLQASTAEIMREALMSIKMDGPCVPLISNKTAAPMTDVGEIKEALVYQITHGVRWRETILALPALGVAETVEVSPGSVLTGLTSRIVPELGARKLEIV